MTQEPRGPIARRRHTRRTRRAAWWWAAGIGAIVLAWLGWMALRPTPGTEETGIPITTFVGKSAPVLEFPDAEGRRYRVPQPGRATVIIFHMGFF